MIRQCDNMTRGSGVLPKGQHSWNISVTKEARVDPKVVLESSMECPSRGNFLLPVKKMVWGEDGLFPSFPYWRHPLRKKMSIGSLDSFEFWQNLALKASKGAGFTIFVIFSPKDFASLVYVFQNVPQRARALAQHPETYISQQTNEVSHQRHSTTILNCVARRSSRSPLATGALLRCREPTCQWGSSSGKR